MFFQADTHHQLETEYMAENMKYKWISCIHWAFSEKKFS